MKNQNDNDHAPTQGLSDGNLKPDLSLNMASAEAIFMKKRVFLIWVWTKGQLAFGPDPVKEGLIFHENGLCWGHIEVEVGF